MQMHQREWLTQHRQLEQQQREVEDPAVTAEIERQKLEFKQRAEQERLNRNAAANSTNAPLPSQPPQSDSR